MGDMILAISIGQHKAVVRSRTPTCLVFILPLVGGLSICLLPELGSVDSQERGIYRRFNIWVLPFRAYPFEPLAYFAAPVLTFVLHRLSSRRIGVIGNNSPHMNRKQNQLLGKERAKVAMQLPKATPQRRFKSRKASASRTNLELLLLRWWIRAERTLSCGFKMCVAIPSPFTVSPARLRSPCYSSRAWAGHTRFCRVSGVRWTHVKQHHFISLRSFCFRVIISI
jgi:hypothetical protein